MAPHDPSLAERLLAARTLRGLTQTQLAQRLHLTHSSIAHFERDGREPSLRNLRHLAQALDISADYLLGLSTEIDGGNYTTAFMHQLGLLSFEEQELVMDFARLILQRRSRHTPLFGPLQMSHQTNQAVPAVAIMLTSTMQDPTPSGDPPCAAE
jgi:transcriptional regulator with XRE-family HTH domain